MQRVSDGTLMHGVYFLERISEVMEEKTPSFLAFNAKVSEQDLKPRPNDHNMPTQHVATLLGATCCVRLATVLRCVGCC